MVYVSTSSYEIGLPRTSTAVGIYKSVDGGNSWNAVNNGLATVSPMISVDVNALAASPTTPGLLYAGTGNGAVRSTDGGTGWALTGLARQVFSMVIDPTDDDTAFAGTDSGLFQTTDGGVTWERMDSVPSGRVASLAIDPKGRMLYAAVNNVGIFKGVR